MVVKPAVEPPVVSLFEEHSLSDTHDFTLVERLETGNNFGFVILLLCSFIIIFLQRNSDGIFSSVLKASFDRNLANQDARVENSQRSRNLLWLQLIASLSVGLFASITYVKLYEPELTFGIVFLWAIGLMLNITIAKRLVQWLLAQIFDLHPYLKIHRFSGNVLFATSGLVLLPLSMLMLFSPQIPFLWIVIAGAVTCGFFYLKGLQRGFLISMSSIAVSPLHLFYYFCALEILPIFVLIRFAL